MKMREGTYRTKANIRTPKGKAVVDGVDLEIVTSQERVHYTDGGHARTVMGIWNWTASTTVREHPEEIQKFLNQLADGSELRFGRSVRMIVTKVQLDDDMVSVDFAGCGVLRLPKSAEFFPK